MQNSLSAATTTCFVSAFCLQARRPGSKCHYRHRFTICCNRQQVMLLLFFFLVLWQRSLCQAQNFSTMSKRHFNSIKVLKECCACFVNSSALIINNFYFSKSICALFFATVFSIKTHAQLHKYLCSNCTFGRILLERVTSVFV